MTVLFWLFILAIIYYLASITPMPRFLLPTIFVGFLPAIIALILVIIAALFTPLTNITINQAAVKDLWITDPNKFQTGPLWPILFVTIACGAISGWHSLVSSGLSSKQLEFETDARPVGAGAMITEGIVGLSSVAAAMIIVTLAPSVAMYPQGAGLLTNSLTGIDLKGMTLFYSVFVVVMGLITSMLFVRVWRLVSAELFEKTILRNKHVATIVMLLIMIFLAFTGSWTNLWIYFGGTNQLLAGLALLLVAVYLASVKRPPIYVLIPGIFMAITTIAALIWETYIYSYFLINNKALGPQVNVAKVFGQGVVQASNAFSAALGAVLAVLGIIMTYYLIRGYIKYRKGAVKV
jgi:carbon starvation protein